LSRKWVCWSWFSSFHIFHTAQRSVFHIFVRFPPFRFRVFPRASLVTSLLGLRNLPTFRVLWLCSPRLCLYYWVLCWNYT
jgi:hypothetical protein